MSGAQAPSPQALVTGDELARVPNLGRCELVPGRVVHMSPRRASSTARSKLASRPPFAPSWSLGDSGGS